MKNNLKYLTTLIVILLALPILIKSNVKNENKIVSLIDKLNIAEKNKDINAIISLFDMDAIIVYPGLPPIFGIDAIKSIYQFIWKRPNLQTSEYKNESIKFIGNKIQEEGFYYYKEKNMDKKFPYKAILKIINGSYKIINFKFGKDNINSEIPKFIKPTGKYSIGRTAFFYKKRKATNDRYLSFEIWYPSQSKGKKKALYQSKEISRAFAEFAEWPLFYNSHLSILRSNSYINAKGYNQKRFPIVVFHHGYSGYTSVYQSIFEELASHGYILVSIAHQNESAILIKEDFTVFRTDRNNKFYKSHSAELNGKQINSLQYIILNSDDLKKNTNAYINLIKLSPLHNESTRLWVMDTRSVIKKLKEIDKKDHNLKGVFDFSKIGIMGHSVGGATAGQMAADSDLIKAGINLDGFQFGDLIRRKIKIPFMFVSGNSRGKTFIRFTTFMDNSETICYQAIIKGFSHGTFTDQQFFKPGGESDIKLQRDLILTFFNIYLKGKEETDLKKLESKYKIITIHSNMK